MTGEMADDDVLEFEGNKFIPAPKIECRKTERSRCPKSEYYICIKITVQANLIMAQKRQKKIRSISQFSPARPILHASYARGSGVNNTDGDVAKKHNFLFVLPRFAEFRLDKIPFLCVGYIAQRHPEINGITPHAVQGNSSKAWPDKRAVKSTLGNCFECRRGKEAGP